GAALVIANAVPSDQTQMWSWSGQQNTSTFTNVGYPAFSVDNNAGGVNTGNQVQIWSTTGSPNQVFAMALIPALAGQ
ncbi:MAG: hypothetical protein QOH21_3135, partial [Acidobacteriota bacterium]|nr:hypothetical protein [Acidobacteriota bacterium]